MVRDSIALETPSDAGAAAAIPTAGAADRRLSRLFHGLSLALVVLPVACALVAELRLHWTAVSDDAVIALRSWQVLGARSPQLGQFSQLGVGGHHPVFDLGPLLYWTLAVPVHLDPTDGVLWGAALLAALAGCLAVEAARAASGRAAGLVVGVGFLVLLCTTPGILENPAWNPNVGALWFAASCVLAWSVMVGGTRWIPALVLSSSLAAQSHLLYVLPSLLVLACAAGATIALHRRHCTVGLLVVTVLVALACWISPLWQQLTGHPGNMSLILDRASGRTLGWPFGLRAVAAGVGAPPLFLDPLGHASFLEVVSRLTNPSLAEAGGIAASLAAVVVYGIVRSSKGLAFAGLSALVACVGVAVTLSRVPLRGLLDVDYLDVVLYPLGILVWGVWLSAVADLLRLAWARFGTGLGKKLLGRGAPRIGRTGAATAALAASTLIGLALVVPVYATVARDPGVRSALEQGRQVRTADRLIRRALHGPETVRLEVSGEGDFLSSYSVAFGLAWSLTSQGWRPELAPELAAQLGARAVPTPHAPVAQVHLSPDGGVSVDIVSSSPSRHRIR